MNRLGRKRPGRWLLRAEFLAVLSTAALVIAFMVDSRTEAGADLLLAIGFASAFFVARLLPIRLPQGDEVYATLMVGLVGLVFVSAPLLMCASLAAGVVDTAARASSSTKKESMNRLADTVRSSSLLGIASPWQLLLRPLVLSGTAGDQAIPWALAAAASYALMDLFTMAASQSLAEGRGVSRAAVSLIKPLSTVYLVHVPMVAVVTRLQSGPWGWEMPVALLLTLILQNSFNLYLRIRRGYAETIRALAHAAELDRPDDSGHAQRVADLSVAVARRLGFRSSQLEKIGYAALLHDVGRMGFRGDGGSLCTQRGAEIVMAIPFLEGVAPLIHWSHDDGVRRPTGWTIVRTCSDYDRLVNSMGAQAALNIVQQISVDDPRVTEALRCVVESKLPTEAR